MELRDNQSAIIITTVTRSNGKPEVYVQLRAGPMHTFGPKSRRFLDDATRAICAELNDLIRKP